MSNYFAYMRISTKEERGKQKFSRQEKSLERFEKDHNIDFVWTGRDDASGKNFNRKDWKRLESLIHEGDTIVFKDITRFTRQAEDGYEKYMWLMNDKGVSLIFIDNPTLNTDYIRKMIGFAEQQKQLITRESMAFIAKIVLLTELDRAEQERLTISKRTKDGIAAAHAAGHKSGRPVGALDKMTPELRADLEGYMLDRSIKGVDIMKKHGISRNTMKKYCQTIKDKIADSKNVAEKVTGV